VRRISHQKQAGGDFARRKTGARDWGTRDDRGKRGRKKKQGHQSKVGPRRALEIHGKRKKIPRRDRHSWGSSIVSGTLKKKKKCNANQVNINWSGSHREEQSKKGTWIRELGGAGRGKSFFIPKQNLRPSVRSTH